MPDYFGTRAQDLNQAAAFGQNVGQSLSQGLIQQPYQRAILAQGLARMQAENQLRQMGLNLQGQRLQDLDAYRQSELQQRGQYEDLSNQYRLLQAQIASSKLNRGNYKFDPWGQMYDANTGQYPQPAVATVQPQSGGVGTGQATNNATQTLPTQPAQQLTPQLQHMQNQQQMMQDREKNALMNQYMMYLSNTNMQQADPKLGGMLSNQLYGGQSPQPVQQLGGQQNFQLSPTNQPQNITNRIGRFLIQQIGQ